MIEIRLTVNNRSRQHRQIVSRTVLPWRIQAVHGFKVGITQIQLLHVVVHHADELRLTARYVVS
ncbi:hypothetical protein D3C84_1299780 [compost metagenome]